LCVPFAYKDFYPDVPASMIAATCTALLLAVGGALLLAVQRAWAMLATSVFLAAVFVGTLLTAIIISLTVAPAFFPRYMLACAGLFTVGVSLGISAMPVRSLRPAALSLFVLLNLPVLRDVHIRQFNGRMREMAHVFHERVQPGDLIVTLDSFCTGPSMYYFPAARHCFCVSDREAPWQRTFKVFEPRLAYRQRLAELLSSRTSFWLMSSRCAYSSMKRSCCTKCRATGHRSCQRRDTRARTRAMGLLSLDSRAWTWANNRRVPNLPIEQA
jgi:hypothetical protein